MMLAARGAIRASGAGLPYDAEIEYLESTGTQWIDTGFKANTTTTRLDIELMLTQSTTNMGLFGSRNATGTSSSSSCNAFFLSANQVFRMDWANGGGPFFNCLPNTAYSISITRGSVTINGSTTTYTNTDSVDQKNNFLIFSFAEGSGVVYQKGMIGRVFGAKIYSNYLLVRDYIPVRKGAVGYLYDRVTGKLYGNAGSGDFVVGQDVVPVEYIESHGTEYIDTGVKGSQNLRTTFDYQLVYSGTAPTAKGLFGCYTNGAKYHLYCSGGIPTDFQVGMGGTYFNTIRVDNVRHSIEFNNGTVSIDGNVVVTFNPYGDPTAHTLLLFALHNDSGGLYSMTPMRKWSVQIWDNGTPVRFFRPVRVGTEGAMMDTLTRRIYRNAGTGAFTYGNDLKYPIPA